MGTPDSPSTPTTDTSTPPFRAGGPSYVWAGLGAITGLALLAWVFFVPAKHVDPLSTFEHRMVVAYVWFAVFLTGTWWLVKDRSGNTLRRGHLFLMWGGTVLIGIVSFSALLNAALANAYAYAGRNYIVLQTVSAVVSATATMIYVLCTVGLLWQGKAARASQERWAKEQKEAQDKLTAEQSKTNASIAACLAALTKLLEEQQKAQAQPLVLIAPPPQTHSANGHSSPTSVTRSAHGARHSKRHWLPWP